MSEFNKDNLEFLREAVESYTRTELKKCYDAGLDATNSGIVRGMIYDRENMLKLISKMLDKISDDE